MAWSEYDVQVRGLHDLYVRFFRLAERRIADVGKRGIVCFISNFSWLDGQSHPVMRKRFLDAFDEIWIDNCNGDKYRDRQAHARWQARPVDVHDRHAPVGIQVGTAIATHGEDGPEHDGGQAGDRTISRFVGYWQRKTQRNCCERSNVTDVAASTQSCSPSRALRFILMPAGAAAQDYACWPRLARFFIGGLLTGIKTSRDELVVDIDREALVPDGNTSIRPSPMRKLPQVPSSNERGKTISRECNQVGTRESVDAGRQFCPILVSTDGRPMVVLGATQASSSTKSEQITSRRSGTAILHSRPRLQYAKARWRDRCLSCTRDASI